MKGDRDKAIQAGASDYVTKPVDPEKLLSIMDIWLRKSRRAEAKAQNERKKESGALRSASRPENRS